MKKHTLIALALTALSTNAFPDSDSAKIRIFGQNGASAKLYAGQSCTSGKSIKVSGSIGQAFGSFVGASKNESIGIPETATTQNLSDKNGILSKAYYKEYEIPANQPSTVSLRFQDVSHFYKANGVQYSRRSPSCRGDVSFTAKPHANYEVGFSWGDDKCNLTINEVTATGTNQVAQTTPVEVRDVSDCD